MLGQLNKYKFISDAQFDSIKKLPIKLNYEMEDHTSGLAQYFREELRGELGKWCKEHQKADGSPYNLYKDGLRITQPLILACSAMQKRR